MLTAIQKNQVLDQAKPFLLACQFVSSLMLSWNIPTIIYPPKVLVCVVSKSGLKQVYVVDQSLNFVVDKKHDQIELPIDDHLSAVFVSFDFGIVFANDNTLRFAELIALDETLGDCLVSGQIVFDFFSDCFTDDLKRIDTSDQKEIAKIVSYYQNRFDRLALSIGVEKLMGGAL